jgi:ATP-dependent Clp protease ATP-binding subunit ClpC
MDKAFHLFIRQLSTGYAAQVLTHPHLASFGPDLTAVRSDLAHVLTKLLDRGEMASETTFFPDARMRRLDVLVRAVQARRLIEVPLRFSVVSLAEDGAGRSGGRRRARPEASGHQRFLVPRLGLEASLEAAAADLDSSSAKSGGWAAWVEEMIRHELHLAPLSRLLHLTWTGPEQLETLTVTARSAEKRERPRPAAARSRVVPPPGLGEACRRLNDEATAGTLERAFQRETELGLLAGILGARTRPSVLLVGPEGAGKTSLVHELVQRAAASDGSAGSTTRSPVHGLEVWSTSAGRIVAGMRYLGEWQGRLERMLGELRLRRAVLHIESLAELVSVGHGSDVTDVARFLVPAVEAGDVSLIIEATPEDTARAERTHAALLSAMRPLMVAGLQPGPARLALSQAAHAIGRRRRVRFEDAALSGALDLAERFGTGPLPGEAVGLLRAAAQAAPSGGGVGAAEVTAAFTARTGYPRALIDPAVRLSPDEVLAWLRGRVAGQDEAMQILANLVVTLKTNLADPGRPLGSFLFLGPTGVGKTESALALAAYLFGDDRRLHRFDMAEYAAPGSAARMASAGGAQPSLARRVREQPFGVVLLDEIEKADGGVHDLLLQVLGEGRLGDGSGRTVSFKNTVVILTSNLGAEGAGRSLGFGPGAAAAASAAAAAHYRSAAAAFFRPELLNRFDQIVPYRPLTPEVVARLARRMLGAALGREGLLRRGLQIDFDDAVVARLAELGFDARLGARPLKRAIETHVVAPLARLVARTAHRPRARLRLGVGDGGEIVVESAPAP